MKVRLPDHAAENMASVRCARFRCKGEFAPDADGRTFDRKGEICIFRQNIISIFVFLEHFDNITGHYYLTSTIYPVLFVMTVDRLSCTHYCTT